MTTAPFDAITDIDELRTLRSRLTARLGAALENEHGDNLAPGRRVRVDSSVTPLVLANLTGTIEEEPSSKPGFAWMLLDESSTQALRQDHRAGRRRPPATTTRARLHIPTACLLLADHDN